METRGSGTGGGGKKKKVPKVRADDLLVDILKSQLAIDFTIIQVYVCIYIYICIYIYVCI